MALFFHLFSIFFLLQTVFLHLYYLGMGVRGQFQKLLDRKQQEIANLELELEKARAYVQAMQDSMRFLPKELGQGAAEQSLRPNSALAKARDAIKAAGKPLHINELLKAVGKPNDKNSRVSLGGSLSGYVRKGQIFTRPAPNTFGLIGESVEANGAEPIPDDFGSMDK